MPNELLTRLRQLATGHTVQNIGTLFTGTLFARIFSALAILLIARQVGVDNFGLYTATLSLAKLSSIIFSLGLDNWLLRNGNRQGQTVGTAVSLCLLLKGSLGVGWLLLLFLVTPFLRQDVFPLGLVMISGLSVFFEEINQSIWAAFKTSLRNQRTSLLMIITQSLLFGSVLLLMVMDVKTPGPFMVGRLLAYLVGGGVAAVYLRRSFSLQLDRTLVKSTVQETVPFALSHGLAVIYERADVTLIAFFLGKTAAGIYGPAITLMTTLFLVPAAVYEVMLPTLSRMHSEAIAQIRSTAYRLTQINGIIGVALGVGMALLAYPLVWFIYTAEFLASAHILTILSTVLIFKSMSFAFAAVITAVGWQSYRVIVQLIAAIFNIGVNLLIINRFGIEGVAYVYVATEAILMLGYFVLMIRWQEQQAFSRVPS